MKLSQARISADELAAIKIDQRYPRKLGASPLSKSEETTRLANKQLRANMVTGFNEIAVAGNSEKPPVSLGTGDDLRKGAKNIRKAQRQAVTLSKGAFLQGRY
jgi:hypothetical protein